MMGIHQAREEFFSCPINLGHRVCRDHPLGRVAAVMDFTFVGVEVARFYGRNGNQGIDSVILAKLMFLFFCDDVASERELMERRSERLDGLWFLGCNLEEQTPRHSVLSKARRRWGPEVFRNIFIRTVPQCVEAGLVEGRKRHVDSSLIDAAAANGSLKPSWPERIAADKQAVAAQETKLEEGGTPENYVAFNGPHVSSTDPDALAGQARRLPYSQEHCVGAPRPKYGKSGVDSQALFWFH